MTDYTEIRAKIKSTLEEIGLFYEIYPSGDIPDLDCERFACNPKFLNTYIELNEEEKRIFHNSRQIGKTQTQMDIQEYNSIPKEVREAARLLENYFKTQGIDKWELMGVCSRNYAWELENSKELLKSAAKAIDDLLIFAHQHTETPLLREIAVKNRIEEFLDKKQNLY